ncbi:hypothetical protein EDD15DRAFT_1791311 [Pisolithus albus]|nr:hypothetical protein EDD15DRAFT_1791311 [Pisolithus albus]
MMTRKRSSFAFVSAGQALGGAATALFAVRVSSPAIVFLTTLSLLYTKPFPSPSPSPITPVVVQSRVPRTTLILVFLSLSAVSFLIDGLAYITYAVFNRAWSLGTGIPLASVLGLVAYAGLAAVGAWKDINNVQVWFFTRVRLAIAMALALDITQVVLTLSINARDRAHLCSDPKLSKCIPDIFHLLTPCLRALFLFTLLLILNSPRITYNHVERQPESEAVGEENTPLQEDGPTAESSKYGTFITHGQCESGPPPVSSDVKCESSLATLRRLGRYICPSNSKSLEFAFAVTTFLHLIVRVLKPLSPISLGAAVNAFVSPSAVAYPIPMPLGTSPYPYIFLFVTTYFLTSQGGIPALILALGACIGERADAALESAYVAHLSGLLLGNSAGLRVKGSLYPTGAVSKLLEAVSVSVAAFLDSLIGAIVLGLLFGWQVALGALIVLSVYVLVTIVLSRTLSLCTVPYSSSRVYPAFALFTLVQALIACGGLLLGSLYVAQGVVDGIWSVGGWVAWVWYWVAIVLPLSSIPCPHGTLLDVRFVLDALNQPTEVADCGKLSLEGEGGAEVRFENVSFTYPDSAEHAQSYGSLLSSVSFTLDASSTVALVGAPGSGKSTIMKLLYRLYLPDVNGGSIYIDGKDIRDLSSHSLREKLAIVAKVDADERRAAISRALAKAARVVLVEGDLDDETLTLVSGARTVLWEVGATNLGRIQGRVDQIIVLKDGEIVEQGAFDELVGANGVFASMWAEYVQSTSALADSPRPATTSLRPTDSVRAPSFRAPAASIRAESTAPIVPPKDNTVPVSFPTSGAEEDLATAPTPVAFPTSGDPSSQTGGPVAFPVSDDARSVASQPRAAIPGHVQGASVTFDTTTTPPRSGTPDPSGTPNADATEGKRKRISSQNFQRLARRISLSTPRKGAGIPGIANIANVLKRDSSFKADNKDKDEAKTGESSSKDADVASATGSGSGLASGADSARNSGEISRQAEKDKEREEKKKRRRSFMQFGSGGST